MADLCLKKVNDKYEIISGRETYDKAKTTGLYVVKASVSDENDNLLGDKVVKMKEIIVD